MKDYPILCNDDTVRAIQAGLQTQVRRPVFDKWIPVVEEVLRVNGKWTSNTLGYDLTSPFGVPGDRLWVREGTRLVRWGFDGWRSTDCAKYSADDEWVWDVDNPYGWFGKRKFKPPMHMPRGWCRTFLPVTAVRVERVQDISKEDIRAEGIRGDTYPELGQPCAEDPWSARIYFMERWNALYGTWSENPLVWVGTFRTPEQPEQ